MAVSPTTLTLDTNLLWAHWKDRPNAPYVRKLLALQRNGQVELVVTSRVHADIPDEPWASRLKEELDKLDVLEIGSVTRLDHWHLGADKLPSKRFLEVMSTIRARRPQAGKHKPADVRDWDHLHGHYLSGLKRRPSGRGRQTPDRSADASLRNPGRREEARGFAPGAHVRAEQCRGASRPRNGLELPDPGVVYRSQDLGIRPCGQAEGC